MMVNGDGKYPISIPETEVYGMDGDKAKLELYLTSCIKQMQ